MPALVAGPTVYRLGAGGEWERAMRGGRLVLVDLLWDLSYGPQDVVLMDGNLAHGVTTLCDLPGGGQVRRPELERFSLILFNRFQRERAGMGGHSAGMWQEKWRTEVPWREGCKPPQPGRKRGKWDKHAAWEAKQ